MSFPVTMHHIVSDGWSMQILIDEFVHLYSAWTQGREPELPELPIQYADYAIWQRAWLEAGEATASSPIGETSSATSIRS